VSPRLDVCSSVAGIFTMSAAVPAAAADLNPVYKAPVPAIASAFNWNGFYVGANVGGAWASDTVTQSNLADPFPNQGKINSSGIVGGGQFGYNWVVAPNWILGIEADVSGADLNGAVKKRIGIAYFNEKIDAFGTARGRVGYVADNWLFYGTGGFAWSDDTFTRTCGRGRLTSSGRYPHELADSYRMGGRRRHRIRLCQELDRAD
jgi:outer membrane immunogenic protein